MNEEVAKQIYESLEQFRKLKKQHEKKSKVCFLFYSNL